jgi:nitrite reductase/ring-hydroxylating ferredoxin subunit
MQIPIAQISDIAPGGLKEYSIQGHEILLCNVSGSFYAVERRCGHMNAPCEMGTLRGTILTCPMHYAQFDVTTGKALKPAFIKSEPEGLPETLKYFFEHKSDMVSKITTCNLDGFPVEIKDNTVFITL